MKVKTFSGTGFGGKEIVEGRKGPISNPDYHLAQDGRLSYCFIYNIATSGHGCPGERPYKTGGRIGTGCVAMRRIIPKQLERLHP